MKRSTAKILKKPAGFYDVFERKPGDQLTTHYCPGCGHGIMHKLIAEAIDSLGVQDQTILINSVGCSVFAYYYLDVGNVQVPHGRCPAAGTGIKRAHPESLVIGKTGVVRGSCKVKNAIIGGQLFGNVTAENKIELQSGSHVEGDIKTKRLVIDEGVFFEGSCSMGDKHAHKNTGGARPDAKPADRNQMGSRSQQLAIHLGSVADDDRPDIPDRSE